MLCFVVNGLTLPFLPKAASVLDWHCAQDEPSWSVDSSCYASPLVLLMCVSPGPTEVICVTKTSLEVVRVHLRSSSHCELIYIGISSGSQLTNG